MATRTIEKNGYPTSDGKPMAETDLHRLLMNDLIFALQQWYADDPPTYVSGNLLLFYEQGNKHRHVAPDVFVVFGVGNHIRPNYLLWEEGASPSVVIELTSSSTRREDSRTKMELYRELGVKEYFLFDPNEDYLAPSFQGHRLTNGEYRPIRLTNGRLRSRQLGLFLTRVGTHLRFIDPDTDNLLRNMNEEHQALIHAEQQARDAEQQARDAEQQAREEQVARREAESEVARLQRELGELRRRAGL